MVVIVKKRGETKDNLFRKFSMAFMNEDVLNTLRKKQFYKRPSLVRKDKEKERRTKRYNKPYTKKV